jgi:hypothetical protein
LAVTVTLAWALGVPEDALRVNGPLALAPAVKRPVAETEPPPLTDHTDHIDVGWLTGGSATPTSIAGVNTITAGDGNSTVFLSGNGNDVTFGNGDETVSISGGNNKIAVGNGDNTISLAVATLRSLLATAIRPFPSAEAAAR